MRPLLDCAIAGDQLEAERRYTRAAAALAAGLGRHHLAPEGAVEAVDQHPGATVRHAKRAAAVRDRAAVADRFEQANLARPHRLARPEIDAQGKLRQSPLS